MNNAYIRVLSDKSTVENQRFEIINYCNQHNIIIDNWIEKVVTGTKDPEKRKFGTKNRYKKKWHPKSIRRLIRR